MERIICLVIGYVCGLFQTGYIIGKLHKTDIREHGSGNAGTTNAFRTFKPFQHARQLHPFPDPLGPAGLRPMGLQPCVQGHPF